MSKYAERTSVSTQKSRLEIEQTLERYGAEGFCYASQGNRAMVQFVKNNKVIQFRLKLPDKEEFRNTPGGQRRWSTETIEKAWEQGCRQRWRALALIVKAKLEAVESGVTTFETEFMPHILLADGRTVGDVVLPEIEECYKIGKAPERLLLTEKQ